MCVEPKRQHLPKQRKVVIMSKHPTGLSNNGNTCYLNGILQALLSVSTCWISFSKYLHRDMPSMVRTFIGTLSQMKKQNDGRKTSRKGGKGVDTMPLLRDLQKTKASSGDKDFRWKRQNDAGEVLIVLIEELEKAFGPWAAISTCPRRLNCCDECHQTTTEEDLVHPFLILKPMHYLSESLEFLMRKRREKIVQECHNCDSIQTFTQQSRLN